MKPTQTQVEAALTLAGVLSRPDLGGSHLDAKRQFHSSVPELATKYVAAEAALIILAAEVDILMELSAKCALPCAAKP